jgi:glycosyltransferase involved in cell wall biosynthesis
MPVRVLHLDSGREWRGGQRQLVLLADGQRAAGLEPLVAAPPQSSLVAQCRSIGVAVAAVRMRSRLDLFAARRISALISTWRPDVIHAHDPRSLALARVALMVRAPIPLVVTRRTSDPVKHPQSYRRGVSRIIAISESVVATLQRAGIATDQIRLVYPGVTTPHVARPRDWRAECAWAPDDLVVGVVHTGDGDALAALAAALPVVPAAARARVRLVVLGGASTGIDALADVPCYRAGLVHEVHAAIAGFDLLVQPVVGEGLGSTVVEALALQRPVIVARDGSLAEVIEDERSGIYVAPGDSAALATALTRLLADPAERTRLGAAGPARAARFAVSRMVSETDAVYAELHRTSQPLGGISQ